MAAPGWHLSGQILQSRRGLFGPDHGRGRHHEALTGETEKLAPVHLIRAFHLRLGGPAAVDQTDLTRRLKRSQHTLGIEGESG